MITAAPNYVGLSDELSQLDEQISALQGAKKDIYTKVRENYGKKTADALKLAVKLNSLPSEKRSDRDAVEEDAFRILAIIQAPRVARGARAHGNIEEFSSYAQAKLVENVAAGMQTESGRKALVAAVDIMIERDEHIDPETGEITNPVAKASEDNGTHEAHDGQGVTGDASRPSVGGGAHAADTSEGASANVSEGVTAGETAPNSPETANEAAGKRPVPSMSGSTAPAPVQRSDASNSAKPLGVTVVGTESGTVANSEITPDPRPLTAADGQPRIPSSSPGCAKSDGAYSVVGQGRESENCITGNQEEHAVDQFTPPAFLAQKSMRDYRPHCQRPDACGASGLKHCYSCSKLVQPEGEVA